MAVADWQLTAALNTTIEGVNIAEGCPSGNVNDVVRAMAAALRAEHDALPDLGDYVLLNGTTAFTGQPKYSGRGAFHHHNNPANASGRWFIAASGGAAPSGAADGDFWAEY